MDHTQIQAGDSIVNTDDKRGHNQPAELLNSLPFECFDYCISALVFTINLLLLLLSEISVYRFIILLLIILNFRRFRMT